MKVLISDDDATIRLLMRTLLQRSLSYEVVETVDGEEAWKALDSGTAVDLCILDLWMPRLGGIDLLAKMRADPRFARQKVMLCTTENGRNHIVRAISLGISGYVLKPFVAQQFLDQVRKVCQAAAAGSPSDVLEPTKIALERLGTDRKSYLELLKVFSNDVGGLIGLLRDLASQWDAKELTLRVNGLCGSGRSLGARSMATALARLEKSLQSGDPAQARSHTLELHRQNEWLNTAIAGVAAQPEPAPSAPSGKAEKPKAPPAATEAAPAKAEPAGDAETSKEPATPTPAPQSESVEGSSDVAPAKTAPAETQLASA